MTPDKPFFLYLSFGATHSPHHVAPEWIEKYKGKFDKGWDAVREETLANMKEMGLVPEVTQLTNRSSQVRAWDALNDTEKKVYARLMETYAGFAEHTDAQVMRVIDALEEIGVFDDTIFIYIAPTILEAASLPEPYMVNGVAQKPIEGVSMAYTFDDAEAEDRHVTQYFQMFGNRGIYHEGWTAVRIPACAGMSYEITPSTIPSPSLSYPP